MLQEQWHHRYPAPNSRTSKGYRWTGINSRHRLEVAGQTIVTVAAYAVTWPCEEPAIVYPDTEALQSVLQNPGLVRHIRTNPINGTCNIRLEVLGDSLGSFEWKIRVIWEPPRAGIKLQKGGECRLDPIKWGWEYWNILRITVTQKSWPNIYLTSQISVIRVSKMTEPLKTIRDFSAHWLWSRELHN